MRNYRMIAAAATLIILDGIWAPVGALADVIYDYTFLPGTTVTFPSIGTEQISGNFSFDYTTYSTLTNNVTTTGSVLSGQENYIAPDGNVIAFANTVTNQGFSLSFQNELNIIGYNPVLSGRYIVDLGNVESPVIDATLVLGGAAVSAPAAGSGAGLLSLAFLVLAGVWSKARGFLAR